MFLLVDTVEFVLPCNRLGYKGNDFQTKDHFIHIYFFVLRLLLKLLIVHNVHQTGIFQTFGSYVVQPTNNVFYTLQHLLVFK